MYPNEDIRCLGCGKILSEIEKAMGFCFNCN